MKKSITININSRAMQDIICRLEQNDLTKADIKEIRALLIQIAPASGVGVASVFAAAGAILLFFVVLLLVI